MQPQAGWAKAKQARSHISDKQRLALENYDQALPLARSIKDHLAQARVLAGIGLVLRRLGENPEVWRHSTDCYHWRAQLETWMEKVSHIIILD